MKQTKNENEDVQSINGYCNMIVNICLCKLYMCYLVNKNHYLGEFYPSILTGIRTFYIQMH